MWMCRWNPGTLEPLTYTRASSAEFCNIHLQSVVLALTSRLSNKVYREEFAKRGGGRRVGQIDIQRGTQKNRIRELKQ